MPPRYGIPISIFLFRNVFQGIHGRSVYADLKVQVRSGTYARITTQCDLFTLSYLLAHLHEYLGKMSVTGLLSILVLDEDTVSIAACPAGLRYGTATGSHDGGTHGSRPVNALMIGACAGGRLISLAKVRADLTA